MEFYQYGLGSPGFAKFFNKMVHSRMVDAMALVEINSARSKSFLLLRSIRQGCPLARALFVIAADCLHYILRDNSLSPRVKGIALRNLEEISNVQFGDDTSLLIELTITSLPS